MKRLLILSAAVVVTSCASWTPTQKALGVTSVALDVVDYTTTKKCLSMTNCHEANPILGEHPSESKLIAFKAVTAAGKLAIADAFPKVRTQLLTIMNVMQFAVDAHNAKLVGFHWGF